MRQTISTKYLGPTATKGARIRATSSGGYSRIYAWDHRWTEQGNAIVAAKALRDELGWRGVWVGGALPLGYVFVDVSEAVNVHTPTGTLEADYREGF